MFYTPGINTSNPKQMFDFLHDHFRYYVKGSQYYPHYTYSSADESIAHNVKLPNLSLEGDPVIIFNLLLEEGYDEIDKMIEKWQQAHPKYVVRFRGSNQGYLVLCNKHNYKNILPALITDYDYQAFKEYCKEHHGGVKNYIPKLREYVKLVRDFDKLCDQIRNYVNRLSLKAE